jgi:phage shock protein E
LKKTILITSVILILLMISSFAGTAIALSYSNITVEKVHRIVSRGLYCDYVILDLRPEIMFMSGHIPRAINIPYVVLGSPPNIAALNTWISGEGQSHLNDKIIVHCIGGVASPSVANILIGAGFKKVYNMEGGFNAWKNAGYLVEVAVTHSGEGITSDSTGLKIIRDIGIPLKYRIWCGVTTSVETLTLTIHSSPEEELVGSGFSELCGITKFNKDGSSIITHLADSVWAFPGGTFEGRYIYIVTKPGASPLTWTMKLSMTLHGTGVFEGQTLKLTYDGPQIGAHFIGFLYRPAI